MFDFAEEILESQDAHVFFSFYLDSLQPLDFRNQGDFLGAGKKQKKMLVWKAALQRGVTLGVTEGLYSL